MSGLEIERLQEMAQGMTEEQQRVVARALPDKILLDAVYSKFLYLRGQTIVISQVINS